MDMPIDSRLQTIVQTARELGMSDSAVERLVKAVGMTRVKNGACRVPELASKKAFDLVDRLDSELAIDSKSIKLQNQIARYLMIK